MVSCLTCSFFVHRIQDTAPRMAHTSPAQVGHVWFVSVQIVRGLHVFVCFAGLLWFRNFSSAQMDIVAVSTLPGNTGRSVLFVVAHSEGKLYSLVKTSPLNQFLCCMLILFFLGCNVGTRALDSSVPTGSGR